MLLEQFEAFWRRDTGIQREQLAVVEAAAALPHAVIVSGLRRVGKSTLLAQLAHRLGQEAFYYVNFEDERFLGFAAEDANVLYQNLLELFGERKIFVLDEVQNVTGWERFVRRLMDAGHKFYITGSNASLLSQELGTRLTGRYVPVALYPFSFGEYIRFKGMPLPDLGRMTTTDRASLQRSLEEYLRLGGIPEPLKYPELPLHNTLYNDILFRDIAARHHIDEVSSLKELAFYLMSNPAGLVSFNKLKDQLRLGSANTVKNYIDYLEASWLVFTMNVFDPSVKRQQIAPKKIYAIDTGLVSVVGFSTSPNTGRLLENLVFLALRRQTSEVYYYTTPAGYEVDFYLPQERQLIQVCQDMQLPQTRERELRALQNALHALKLSRGLVLSDQNEEAITFDQGITIEFRAIADWLLSHGTRKNLIS